eukprot:TRINITY_DN2153_c0_g1_i2.p1 TRINITY_DN2153_c0_g1~~TRINITY_DN2153_c0_g1_i2.p1  ORF type:complete len:369 (-),score=69.96 TRINITY_DN2153_c0_g1_i2:148-1254(-)
MGICKCKKRTESFCFVHKKAVCETCIVLDHPTCVVRSYFEWLNDNEYETPLCGICKGELASDNSVRLMCFDLFHPECIDVYASSLPSNTALAGYVCPSCNNSCLIPPSSNTSPLANSIRTAFQKSPWAIPLLGADTNATQANGSPHPSESENGSNTNGTSHSNNVQNNSHFSNPDDARFLEDLYIPPLQLPSSTNGPNSITPPMTPSVSQPPSSQSTLLQTPVTNTYYPPNPFTSSPRLNNPSNSASVPTHLHHTQNPYPSYPPSPSSANSAQIPGVASRKGYQKYANMILDDEDEDKYRKKGIMQLFSFLGLVSRPSDGVANSKRIGRTGRRLRLIIVLGLLVCLWVLYSSIQFTESLDDTITQPQG